MRTITLLFSLLFFTIGLMWVYSIYHRAQSVLPEGVETTVLNKSKDAEKVDVIKKTVLAERLIPPSIRYLYKNFFKSIVVLELVGAFLYLISAIALLRLYSWGRIAVLWTLVFESWLKTSVNMYEWMITIPLERVFKDYNVLKAYFTPKTDWTSGFSSYMSGLAFLGDNGFAFFICYLLFLILTANLFLKDSMAKTFGR